MTFAETWQSILRGRLRSLKIMAVSSASVVTRPRLSCGILTGVSFQSGIDYYKNINECCIRLRPEKVDGQPMPANPLLGMVSVDCAEYAKLLVERKWGDVRRYLWSQGLCKLLSLNMDFYLLASNTAHISLEEAYGGLHELMNIHGLELEKGQVVVQNSIKNKFLHIGDTTASAIREQLFSDAPTEPTGTNEARSKRTAMKVGLLGTQPTMEEDYLKKRLLRYEHIEEILVPEAEARAEMFRYIMEELGMPAEEHDELGRPKYKTSTKDFFVRQALQLQQRGCESIILGCTEIELVLFQDDVGPSLPLFPSAQLHIEAAAALCAGLKSLEDFIPFGERESSPAHDRLTLVRTLPDPVSPRVLSASDVETWLTMGQCIECTAEALVALSHGTGRMPLRSVHKLDLKSEDQRSGFLGQMPCEFDEHCACKVITVFPENSGTVYSSHQGSVLLFHKSHGQLLAVLDAHALTRMRTAAATAAATRAILKKGCHASNAMKQGTVVAILGTGEQALAHAESMSAIFGMCLSRINLYGRNRQRLERAAGAILRKVHAVDVRTYHAEDHICEEQVVQGVDLAVAACVKNADVICTVTSSKAPLLKASMLEQCKPAVHINAVGACTPAYQEIDPEIWAQAEVIYCDSKEACMKEPGDIREALAKYPDRMPEHKFVEVGSLHQMRDPDERTGNTGVDETQMKFTIFKSLGIALEDLVAARTLYENCMSCEKL